MSTAKKRKRNRPVECKSGLRIRSGPNVDVWCLVDVYKNFDVFFQNIRCLKKFACLTCPKYLLKFREIPAKFNQNRYEKWRFWRKNSKSWPIFMNIIKNYDKILLDVWMWSGAKECTSCRSRKMLKNAPTLAIVAVHTAENGPPKVDVWCLTKHQTSYREPSAR